MYVLRIPFTTYPTTPSPIVNVSKWNLLGLGIKEFDLWKCPEKYRHLLRNERRQELNKTFV